MNINDRRISQETGFIVSITYKHEYKLFPNEALFGKKYAVETKKKAVRGSK
jgi:hypothetical protein